jgi:hypothetical protein
MRVATAEVNRTARITRRGRSLGILRGRVRAVAPRFAGRLALCCAEPGDEGAEGKAAHVREEGDSTTVRSCRDEAGAPSTSWSKLLRRYERSLSPGDATDCQLLWPRCQRRGMGDSMEQA